MHSSGKLGGHSKKKGKAVILHCGSTLESPLEVLKTLRCLGPTAKDSALIGQGQSLAVEQFKSFPGDSNC